MTGFFRKNGAVHSVTGRVVYTWPFDCYEARFAVHVDGILASAADKSALRLSRLLREAIGQNQVTETDTTWVLGMKVDHDRDKVVTMCASCCRMRSASDENSASAKTSLPHDPVFKKLDGNAPLRMLIG